MQAAKIGEKDKLCSLKVLRRLVPEERKFLKQAGGNTAM